MTLAIRQIVLAARELESTVEQLQRVLGVNVCYHDPEVGKFGLQNALMTIGQGDRVQFLEVVVPIEDNTAAGRHLDRHGDSGYMLILQTDDLKRDRARFDRMSVRLVWQTTHPDISAVHLHPKDIGAAIVSVDQPIPASSWRWAGPEWKAHTKNTGAQRVVSTTVGAVDPQAMANRWASVLDTKPPKADSTGHRIEIEAAQLAFERAKADVITAFGISMPNVNEALSEAKRLKLPVTGNAVTICGTRFELQPN